MKTIELKKFGKVLTSRSSGKEAFGAIRPTLDPSADGVEIDFSDIIALTPSWADEFFSGLEDMYGDDIVYLPTENKSVKQTLRVLEESRLSSSQQ